MVTVEQKRWRNGLNLPFFFSAQFSSALLLRPRSVRTFLCVLVSVCVCVHPIDGRRESRRGALPCWGAQHQSRGPEDGPVRVRGRGMSLFFSCSFFLMQVADRAACRPRWQQHRATGEGEETVRGDGL